VSNLPTVWTNVLAGSAAVSSALDGTAFLRLAAAASLFYVGGMFLNDAFDESFDRERRPERPLPAGDVGRREVFAIGGLLLAAGELLLAPHGLSMQLGLLLIAAIVFYDYRHKGSAIAPLVMGACRGLVYCIAAAATAGAVTVVAAAGAVVMATYVAALTVVAKVAGHHARWVVPTLIGGISLVDALFIVLVTGSWALAAAAASGFVLTLALQRVVPGD
jgi:4-hydroxybenzoate polyprenyltransferase